MLTILYQYIQTLLDQQLVVEYDKAARQRKNVVAVSDLEKLADASLQHGFPVSFKIAARGELPRL